mgnify:CR=1 FL=1
MLPVPGASADQIGRARAEDPGGGARFDREPCCWGLLILPAAEVAGRPARGRGVAFERRVAATGPALGGVPGQPLLSEATTAVAVAPPPPVRMRMRMRMQF